MEGLRINHNVKTETPVAELQAPDAGKEMAEQDMDSIKQELSDVAKRILGRPDMARKRKTDITMTEQGFVCMRIEKFLPNENLTIGKDNKVEFTAMGKEYAGNRIATATFDNEVILLLSVQRS